MGTAPIMDEAEEDVLYDDLLKERVNHAIFLAASELDDTTLVERSMERLEIAQRAHVQAMLECHEDDRFALRVEVEDALGGLKDAQRFFLTFATEVEDIANEVRLAHVAYPLPPFPYIEASWLCARDIDCVYPVSCFRCVSSARFRRRERRAAST